MMDTLHYAILALRNLVPDIRFNLKCDGNGGLQYDNIQVIEGIIPPKDLLLAKMEELYQIDLIRVPLDNCKNIAKELLTKTDWIFLPDVSLNNLDDFLNYRSNIRSLMQTPIVNPVWPSVPDAVWN